MAASIAVKYCYPYRFFISLIFYNNFIPFLRRLKTVVWSETFVKIIIIITKELKKERQKGGGGGGKGGKEKKREKKERKKKVCGRYTCLRYPTRKVLVIASMPEPIVLDHEDLMNRVGFEQTFSILELTYSDTTCIGEYKS